MPEPRLTIAYSVVADGLSNIVVPEPESGTEILVIVQGSGGTVPARTDIREIRLDSVGVARSRNVAIREARGEILLFGEEEMEWLPEGIADVCAIFEDNPRLAVLLGRAIDENGTLRKRYPAYREPATVWNSARVGTIELAIRPRLVRAAGVSFDEQFGAGTENFLGDEYVFVADANRRKLKVEYFPITFSRHPRASSGSVFGSRDDARARSRVFGRVFGWFAPVMRTLFWARRPSRFGSLALALRFIAGSFPE